MHRCGGVGPGEVVLRRPAQRSEPLLAAALFPNFERHAAANDGIATSHMLEDDFMRGLVRRPVDFDIIVTYNLFGDTGAEAMAALAGRQRPTPSAWVNTAGVDDYGPADICSAEAYPSADAPHSRRR